MYLHRFTVPSRKWLPTVCCLAFTGFGINALIKGITSGDIWLVVTGACCFLLAMGSMLLSTQKHLGEIRWNDDRFEFTIDDREVVSCGWPDIVSVIERGSSLRIRVRQRWRRIIVLKTGMPPELKMLLTKRVPPPTPESAKTSSVSTTGQAEDESQE